MQDSKIVGFLQVAYVSRAIRTTHAPEFASKYLTNQVIDRALKIAERGQHAALQVVSRGPRPRLCSMHILQTFCTKFMQLDRLRKIL
jgi:hypothetical protein